ncbi:hypothetical protein [Phormidesmis priestleyi]
MGIITQTSLLRVFDPIEMHDVIETLQRTLQQLGLDPNKMMASIDHDTDLPASLCLLDRGKLPNIHEFLKAFQTRIEYLINTPDLALDDRQVLLSTLLSELHQVQHSLKQ